MTEEEARLLSEIRGLCVKIRASEGPPPEELLSALKRATEMHFDYLTARNYERIEELRSHLKKAEEEAQRRKEAKERLVKLEFERLCAESLAVSFYPDTLSLLKSPGLARPAMPPRRSADSAAE